MKLCPETARTPQNVIPDEFRYSARRKEKEQGGIPPGGNESV
jgi:hypothetical protein